VKNEINSADVEGLADVALDELETRLAAEMFEVGAAASEKIIDRDHVPAIAEEGVAQMRSQKTGAAGDCRAL
jgi:hypothetical protein